MKLIGFCIVLVFAGDPFRSSAQVAIAQYRLDIPRESLDVALKAFASQTGMQIARFSDVGSADIAVGPVSGSLTSEQALKTLLADSGLTFRVLSDGTIAVIEQRDVRDPNRSAPPPPEAPGGDANTNGHKRGDLAERRRQSPTSSTQLEEVVITGIRASMQMQDAVITGSMIKKVNAETAEAITTVKMDVLKDLGIVNVEQALSQISANVSGRFISTSSVGNYAGGASFANLRDLGSQRTLVLLDGQRLASNAVTGDAIDLNGMPFSAIQKIEVLRDGASSLYGSDTIAGVINFITRKDYQGGEIEANYNRPQEPGGGSSYINFSLGHGNLTDDGYNVMITGSYSRQNELIATRRTFSATGIDPARGLLNTNYSASFPASIVDNSGTRGYTAIPPARAIRS